LEVQEMIASLVRFRSLLRDEEVESRFAERAARYEQLPGLAQKIYLRFRDTGEFGALYVWESEEALEAFRASDLAASIAEAYRVDGGARSEIADVPLVVQPAAGAPAGRSG
jgi:heme-degrading monooxygenase HmoA